MIDGIKLASQEPSDSLEQNRDYDGRYSIANRNVVLAWGLRGKIIDAGSNSPGNFRVSKSTTWCCSYDDMMAIPNGHDLARDSDFVTSRNLSAKISKLKEATL